MAITIRDIDGLQAARRRAAEQMAEECRLASRRAGEPQDRAAFALLEMDLRQIAAASNTQEVPA